MGVPEQVRRQQQFVEGLDKHIKEVSQPPADPEPTPEPTPAPEPTPPEPAPPPVPAAPANDEAALWKQRFLSLQGMYNAQVPQLQQQVKDLMKEVESLKGKPEPQTPTPSKGKQLITDSDVTAFGGDLIDMVRRATQEEVSKVAGTYEAQIKALESQLAEARANVGQVAETTAKVVKEDFFSKLDARLPKWDELQQTSECQAWLSLRAPGTQVTWNDVLLGAANRHDLEAVLEVFGEFFKAHPKYRPGKPAPTPPAPNRELERQVAPAKSGASAPPPQQTKRTYSIKEYETESMRIVRLTQAGRHQEATALEAELNAALAEGRLKP